MVRALRLRWWLLEIHKVSLFCRNPTCRPAWCFEVCDTRQCYCFLGRVTLSAGHPTSIASNAMVGYWLMWKVINISLNWSRRCLVGHGKAVRCSIRAEWTSIVSIILKVRKLPAFIERESSLSCKRSQQFDSVLSQLNPVHTFTYFSQILI
jgi:hypothetical protein